jgi:hypothetical protein
MVVMVHSQRRRLFYNADERDHDADFFLCLLFLLY